MKNIIENNKSKFLIFNGILILLLVISGLVIIYDSIIIDELVYEFLINNFSCDFIDKFMINITKLGNTEFVVLFTTVMFFVILFGIKKEKLSLIFFYSIIGITIINQLLKFTVRRIRPDVNKLIEIGGYSFPSGHAMVSMVLYGLVSYFAYKFIKNKWIKNIIIIINCLVILLIGISRIYLGVHYFSDILVGFLISILFLLVVISYLEKKVFSQN